MTKKRIDLHMHSYYSDDGESSPEELVSKCVDHGIGTMAIADHNCVRANAPGAMAAAAAGITYIAAIEIDCSFQNVDLHVLGYGIDPESADFAAIEENIETQSMAASLKMLDATRNMGFRITKEDMEQASSLNYWKNRWTGEMFAELLLGNPRYDDHPILMPYRPGGKRGDNPYVNFYWDFYSQGKECHAEIRYPKLRQVIESIHRSGGQAVLAHPGVNLKEREEMLLPILKEGLDGIEAFSSYHTASQAAYFYEMARDLKMFATCGSDYHGKTKPSIGIGQHGGIEVEDEIRRRFELK